MSSDGSSRWYMNTLKKPNIVTNFEIGGYEFTSEENRAAFNEYLRQVVGGLDSISLTVDDLSLDADNVSTITGGSDSLINDIVDANAPAAIVSVVTGSFSGGGSHEKKKNNKSASTVDDDLRNLFGTRRSSSKSGGGLSPVDDAIDKAVAEGRVSSPELIMEAYSSDKSLSIEDAIRQVEGRGQKKDTKKYAKKDTTDITGDINTVESDTSLERLVGDNISTDDITVDIV